MIPADVCTCPAADRRWNGYGSCLFCGGAYVAPAGELAPIAIPPTKRPPAACKSRRGGR